MSKYKVEGDLSKERKGNDLFQECRQNVRILSMDMETSKKGNRMFKILVRSLLDESEGSFYLVFEEGKRWLLHQLLEALGLYKKDANGEYELDTDDIILKVVGANFKTVEEDWINKEGERIKVKKSQLTGFFKPLPEPENKNEDKAEEIPF